MLVGTEASLELLPKQFLQGIGIQRRARGVVFEHPLAYLYPGASDCAGQGARDGTGDCHRRDLPTWGHL